MPSSPVLSFLSFLVGRSVLFSFATALVTGNQIRLVYWFPPPPICMARSVLSREMSVSYLARAARKSPASSLSRKPRPMRASLPAFSSVTRTTKYRVESRTAST